AARPGGPGGRGDGRAEGRVRRAGAGAEAARAGGRGMNTDDSGELPEGWARAELGELCNITGGVTKGQKRRASNTPRKVPYLRVANVQRGYLDLSEIKEIEATEAEIQAMRLQRGDVLLIEGGNREHLGRGWIWEDQLPECIHQNHIFRARLRDSGM